MASHITVTDDQKKTITSDLRGTDETTSLGQLETIIESGGSGDGQRVTMTTSGGVYSMSDGVSCAEALELTSDIVAHWQRVAEKLREVAATLKADATPEGGEGGESGEGDESSGE